MALAEETKASGVGVFAFAPGLVLTELITHVEVIAGVEGRMKVFPTIVRMFAKPPEVAAQKAVWIASEATDGKTGMVIRASSLGRMLRGALKEGLRVLMKKPAPDLGFEIKVIPSDQGVPASKLR
jgi:NAD(P)-dependent dehydrogenase (short-subunit alcohol dehydrogenase family)